MMGQSWMGSDFTNDDLIKMNSLVADYTHKLLGEESVNDINCFKIELIPKPESPVVWGKVIIWIAKEEYYQMRAEYFDEDMDLVNYMVASEIKQFNDRKLPAHLEMIPVNKKGHKTIMTTKTYNFNLGLEDSFFSQQEMKRVK